MVENAIEILEFALAASERDVFDFDRFREYLDKRKVVEVTVQAPQEYKHIGPVRVQIFNRQDRRVMLRIQCLERGYGSEYTITASESGVAVICLRLSGGNKLAVAARDGRELVVKLVRLAIAHFYRNTDNLIRTGKHLI
jgi:hypothetical protein